MMKSIRSQTHEHIRVIVAYDDDRALEYIPENYEKLKVQRTGERYFYDLYCNKLKNLVTEGYFIFLDDDDYLANHTVIERLMPQLKECEANIVKLSRKDKIYPRIEVIQSGQIGMPCMVLHHSHKNIANVTAEGRGDSVWILAATKLLPTNFIDLIVVRSDRKGSGKSNIMKV